jgi:phosphorylcholine metabolism protein LicD
MKKKISIISKIIRKIQITFARENPDKTRIRTKDELEIRKNEFLKVCNLLDKLKIRYFLAAGILLGAVRHKSFIPWDWDVELSVYSHEVEKKMDQLISEIEKSGFTIEKYTKELSKLKIDFIGKLPKETTSYTIWGWAHNKKKKIYWRNKFVIPENLIKNMKKIKFFNKYHYAPYPPENYLEHQYGDWKKPNRTSDKSVYLTRNFSGISLVETLIKKIIRKVI